MEHQHYTLIFVPDERSPVRRFQVRRTRLKQGVVGGAVALVLALVMAIDWVRLRAEAVDVDALRAQTRAQAEQLASLTDEVAEVEAALAHLEEFERKVRVIANLPDKLARAQGSVAAGGPEAEPGEGGPEEPEEAAAPPAVEPAPTRPPAAAEFGSEPIAALRLHTAVLLDGLLATRASYAALVDGLETRRVQLASTPSIYPTNGWLTSGYGRRVSPFTGQPHFHSGIDIAANFGTPVVAPAAGRVHFVGRKGALGRAVVLDHGYGLRTTYGHLAETNVKRGQRLERGERLGAVGSTGRSTGPHLHYAISVQGRHVNPMQYILE